MIIARVLNNSSHAFMQFSMKNKLPDSIWNRINLWIYMAFLYLLNLVFAFLYFMCCKPKHQTFGVNVCTVQFLCILLSVSIEHVLCLYVL